MPPYSGFTASVKKIPPTLDNRQNIPPTLHTAIRVPPTLDTAQKVPATLDIAQKVPPILHTAQRDHIHWIPPKKYRLFFPWVDSTFWGFGVGGALTAYARRHARVEATSCQAARNFSALAHLIGDLRSNMLASKVERMMFIRLNSTWLTRSTGWTPRNAQARARVAKSAQKSAAAQQEGSSMSVDLAL